MMGKIMANPEALGDLLVEWEGPSILRIIESRVSLLEPGGGLKLRGDLSRFGGPGKENPTTGERGKRRVGPGHKRMGGAIHPKVYRWKHVGRGMVASGWWKPEEGVGGGATIGRTATVWDGEVNGILNGIRSTTSEQKVLILSDSQAAIRAVKKARRTRKARTEGHCGADCGKTEGARPGRSQLGMG